MTPNTRIRTILPALLVLFTALAAGGCGLYSDLRTATRDMSIWPEGSHSDLTKTIALAPVQNRTPSDPKGHPAMFGNALAAFIADECTRVRLLSSGDEGFPEALLEVPKTEPGLTDNQAIADIGRRNRFNAVILATVYDISGKTERRGVLWFRDSKSFVQFSVGVAVFDLETGAKILDQTYQDEIEIDPFDLQALEKGKPIANPELEEALQEAAEELAESACDRIGELPWKGVLLSAKNPIQIGAGKNAGIEVGDRFDVFAPGRAMEGLQGQRFFLPGKKVARIEVTSVTADSAQAEVQAAEADLAPGYTVRPAQ